MSQTNEHGKCVAPKNETRDALAPSLALPLPNPPPAGEGANESLRELHHPEEKLLSVGMASVLIAQFFSALADNAILIVAIAIVKARGMDGLISMLQESFVIPFILLAPFLGQIADVFPKGRMMPAYRLSSASS